MRKIIYRIVVFILFFLMIFWLCTCQNNQSKYQFGLENFEKYESKLLKVCNQHQYEIDTLSKLYSENSYIHYRYQIILNENEQVDIQLNWSRPKNKNNDVGEELYQITYRNQLNKHFGFNTTLLTELVNGISLKKIDSQFLENYVKENLEKDSLKDDLLLRYPIDFFENHILVCSVTDGVVEIRITGILEDTNRYW